MRKIARSSVKTPASLLGRIAIEAYNEIANSISADRITFSRRVNVNREIYSTSDVHEALRQLFLEKCAYCEQGLHDITIDHFRPTGAAADQHERKTSLHHYSWLAYDWRNLYLSCHACNMAKRNRFPVTGPRLPLLAPLDEARDREKSLLIDPCEDDPAKSLDFFLDGVCHARDKAGRTTIDVLDLNRDDLVRSRFYVFRDYIDRVRSRSADSAEEIFDSHLPHIGAFENFARRSVAALARILYMDVPPRARELEFFVKNLSRLPQDDFDKVMRPSASSDLADRTDDKPYEYAVGRSIPIGRHRFNRGIRRVLIEDFKGINYLKLKLPEVGPEEISAGGMMLLADNGAGKTSVLQAIALAMMGAERANSLKIRRDRLLRNSGETEWGILSKRPARVRVDYHSGDHSEITLDPVTLEFDGHSPYPDALIAYGAHRLLDDRIRRGNRATARVATLFDSKATVGHPEAWLARDNIPFEPIARALAEVLVLQADDGLVRDVEGNIFVKTYGQPTPVEVLSDGYRSVIAMAVDTIRWLLADWPELETARGVVLIDEVDAHLHPRWKLQIMRALREAMPQVQFIATTHDPLCLRGMGPGEVAVMKRSSLQRFDLVTDLPDFRGMSAEQLLMSDYFGLSTTSDPELDIRLARNADALGRGDVSVARENREIFEGMMIGDSPQRQIADAAMLEYLHNRPSRTGKEVSESRRQAIDAVLAAIGAGRTPQ
ncbi:AAA family ATPase [Ensifer sp. ENS11]|uniref:AAA family ATPase n=1 Tax=Ensifer sp. ENS11 TaxID=2769291 RepID=UPI0017860AB5|nr:AAA family ATPase [Ensifer sp. ENS11]MBD9486272.1 AAA family ATPase [Ensifer sp. ENS11]